MKKLNKLLSYVLVIGLILSPSMTVDAEEVVVNQSTPGQYSYTIPATGTYKIEAWGAQGGDYSIRKGGLGGKAEATYKFNKGDVLTYYVGVVVVIQNQVIIRVVQGVHLVQQAVGLL